MVDLNRAGRIIVLRFLAPYAESDERAYLDALIAIGEATAPFALITVFGGGRKLSAAGEREQALWFKATRARMNASCAALAIVRPNPAPKMVAAFRKLWSFPIEVFADEAGARRFLAHSTGVPA
jgi:hypothetical protein